MGDAPPAQTGVCANNLLVRREPPLGPFRRPVGTKSVRYRVTHSAARRHSVAVLGKGLLTPPNMPTPETLHPECSCDTIPCQKRCRPPLKHTRLDSVHCRLLTLAELMKLQEIMRQGGKEEQGGEPNR